MPFIEDAPDFSKIKKVLVIKMRHLGDVLLSTGVISCLKQRHPHLEIDLLINEEGKELLDEVKEISKIIPYDRKKAKKSLISKIKIESALIRTIVSQKYDMVINLTEGDRGNILAILSCAKIRLGQEGSHWASRLTHLYKKPRTLRHIVDKDLDALRRLGIYPEDHEKKLLISRNLHAENEIKRFLDENKMGSYFVLHPVSRWMYKTPEVKKFIELIKKLNKPILITGYDQGEEGLFINAILKECPEAKYFPSKGSIHKLIEIIDKADGLITVDSFPLHIGSALKKPTVCLFGPTSEWDWGPWQNPLSKVVSYNHPCRACYKDGCGGGKRSECLEQIPVNAIIQACQDVFQMGL